MSAGAATCLPQLRAGAVLSADDRQIPLMIGRPGTQRARPAPRPRSWRPAPPPIGLTAAALFAGGEGSRADWRVRSPGTFPCASCPAATSALDAGLEAYHNPAAVRWGFFAASAVIRDRA